MTVFPPSSRAMANRMLSWKMRSLVAFMMRSMTRSDAPSLSRWHWTSAKLSSPRPPTPELTTVDAEGKAGFDVPVVSIDEDLPQSLGLSSQSEVDVAVSSPISTHADTRVV
ncbi:hypothetical protein EYF80_048505 [Liparis tanakae]|uniref:Uncharacterized protein n=1 Tax=Liparis tanakae TaxID=230148 RepID=A0A4Z2FK47_9TELE|nr:hypothetical protein EYF80_048505 [Liparis tanakae]